MAVKRKTHNQAFSSCDRSCNGSKQAAVMRMDCERWDGRALLHGKSGRLLGILYLVKTEGVSSVKTRGTGSQALSWKVTRGSTRQQKRLQ